MKAFSNRDLQFAFKKFNDRFFDGRIKLSPRNVRFGNNEDCEDADGLFTGCEIFIHKDFKMHGNTALLTLLHEMVHADLCEDGYIGYKADGGHGTRFHSGLDRLYKAGAMEGLL